MMLEGVRVKGRNAPPHRERASQPPRPAHPEEPLAFVSVSSGKKEQRRGGRTGGCPSSEMSTKMPPWSLLKVWDGSEAGEKG